MEYRKNRPVITICNVCCPVVCHLWQICIAVAFLHITLSVIVTLGFNGFSQIHIADADASWVASVVCTEFTTSWQQSWRVWTNLPTAKLRSYHVAWTIETHCFTACLSATSGKSSLSRVLPLGFSLELDEGTTSRQCCASCTGFQSSDESTSNWRVLSSRHCLAKHLHTLLTTYIWSRKGLDAGFACLPTDRVLFHAHTAHSVISFAVVGPRVWNLRDEDITPMSFRCELKTYWFSCGRRTMWRSA